MSLSLFSFIGRARGPWVAAALLTILFGACLGCGDDPDQGNGAAADTHNGISFGGSDVSFRGSDGVTPASDVVGDGAASSQDAGGNLPGACDFALTPAAGQPGAACLQPSDCDSGFCVEGLDGRICTRKCVECCPQGFACREAKSGDANFVCMPRLAALCRPCLKDAECGTINPGALCVGYGESGGFCGGTCDQPGDCPVGYACEPAKGSQGSAKQCVRKVGQCGCSPRSTSEGAATYCTLTNPLGSCTGQRKCTTAGLGACDATPAQAETCNGVDDDCDGVTDEDAGGVACDLSNGFGTCKGATVCEAGKSVCKGVEPAAEVCDGQDNDCDGKTDEGFPDSDSDGKADCLDADKDGDTYPDVQDCAPTDPQINPGAKEVCNGKDDNCDGVTDEAGAKGCKTYYADVDGDTYGNPAKSACLCKADAVYTVQDGNDCNDLSKQIYPGAKERCNGADDNCDKAVDEGFQLGGSCQSGKGGCVAYGKMVCAADGLGTTCSAQAAAGKAETCDGVDNDCDGQTDEGFPVGNSCSVGKGACKANGVWQCGAGKAVCSATPLQGKAEVCDGLDNDCDGQTDEGCDDDKDGYCDKFMTVLNNAACSKGQGDCDDTRSDVYPGHTEVCDGRDNDCNGTTDQFTKDCSNGCGKGARTCTNGSWSSCSAPTPKCTSGACCDGCNFKPSTTKCSSSPYKTSYTCSGSCGGQVRKKETYRYCTGSSASCTTSNLKTVDKGAVKTCSSGQLCTQSGSSASCKTCSSGCVSGKCSTQPKYVICIDPQFGGSANGASANGVLAKTLNLDIAFRLRSLLEKDTSNASGGGTWKVVMTRTSDVNPSITARINTCNAAGAHRVLSIAVNAYSVTSARGIETFYYKSSSKSYCSLMHEEVRSRTGFYNRGLKKAAYSIVSKVNSPYACLSAPGFITNSGDVSKLKSSSFRSLIAKGMLVAIQKSFGYSAFYP